MCKQNSPSTIFSLLQIISIDSYDDSLEQALEHQRKMY